MRSTLKEAWDITATVWLITCILAVVLTLACYALSRIRPPSPNSVLVGARPAALHALSRTDAIQCFSDFDRLENHFQYYPWVGLSEPPTKSRYVNIDNADPVPIRRTVNAPARQPGRKKTIWVFGGSTEFGLWVPDNLTITSQLSAILAADGGDYEVVNHGHMAYYSSTEAVLFTTLLRHGQRADLAVFVDGLNEGYHSPPDLPMLPAMIANAVQTFETAAADGYTFILTPAFPPVRVLNRLLGRKALSGASEIGPRPPVRVGKYDIADIYRFNVSTIERLAAAENIKVAFFWQPTPFDYIPGAEERRKLIKVERDMPRLNRLFHDNAPARVFYDMSDLFKNDSFESMYVDDSHYGDEADRRVAHAIATDLKTAGLVP